jgi:hypothetical protein
MNSSLSDFCDSLRSRPSNAIEALLKIAETKDAILNWEREFTSIASQDSSDEWLSPIATTIALALSHVDQAEETILDAFCLSRQRHSVAKTQRV